MSTLKILLVPLLFAMTVAFPGKSFAALEEASFVYGARVGGFYIFDKSYIETLDKAIGGSLGGFIGGSFTENFALTLEFDTNVHRQKISTGSTPYFFHNFVGLGVRFYITDSISLVAAPGAAFAMSTTSSFDSKIGFGGLGLIGYEFLQSKSWAMEFHAKALPQIYQSSDGGVSLIGGVGFGMTWF